MKMTEFVCKKFLRAVMAVCLWTASLEIIAKSREETDGTLALNPLCQEATLMDCQADYGEKKMFVTFDVGRTPVPDKRMAVECGLSSSGLNFRKGYSVKMSFTNGKATGSFPLPKPGKYNLVGVLSLDGNYFFDIWKEIEIFDRSASDPAGKMFRKENIKFDYSINSDKMTVTVRLGLTKAGVVSELLTGHAAVVPDGKGMPPVAKKMNFRRGRGQIEIPLPKPYKPGKYNILVKLDVKGRDGLLLKKDLIVPSTEWLGNKIGLEDVVLPPWTPIKRRGNTITCWGREYTFGKDGLPVSIKSAGRELLSRPIRILLSKNGKPLSWTGISLRIEKFSDSHAVIVGQSEAAGRRFQIRTTLEFDGFMFVSIEPVQKNVLPFDNFTMEIPLYSERALYRHLFSVWILNLPGAVKAGNGIVETSGWKPFAWLGDNYRGLFWCTESDEMWSNRKGNAIEFVRNENEVIFRTNVIKAGQKIKPNWNYSFMLQATPVKSYDPRKARTMRVYGPGKTLDWLWPNPKSPRATTGVGFPEAVNPKEFTKSVNALLKKNILVTPYTAPTFIADGLPETVFFKKNWWFGFEDPSWTRTGWKYSWYCASPAGKGYADFLVWKTKKFVEQYKLSGFYFDQLHPYAYSGKSANAGYEENGVRYATYPIRAQRQLFKRLYAVIKTQPWKTWIWGHMSAKMNIPVLTWLDGYYDGEHPFATLVKNKSYMEVMTLDTFRAEFIGRQWGLAPFFLPEMRGKIAAANEPTRELMAVGMVHDVPVCRLFCNGYEVDRIRRELDLFDYGNSDFYAYYDDVPPASTDMKDVYVSAYKHDNGSVLIVAANLSKEKLDRSGKIRINFSRLGVRPDKLMTWPGRKSITLDGDGFETTVPKMDYRMFVLGTPPEITLAAPPAFEGWTATAVADRKLDCIRPLDNGNALRIRGTGKYITFMSEKVHKAQNGDQAVISFKAKGKGTGQVGIFINKDFSYSMIGSDWRTFQTTEKEQKFQFVFNLKKPKMKSIRGTLAALKNSDILISDYTIRIGKDLVKPQAAKKSLPPASASSKKNLAFKGWVIADLNIRKNSAKHIRKTDKNMVIKGEGKSFLFFDPSEIQIKKGQKVQISFKARGKGSANAGFISYSSGWLGAKVVGKKFDLKDFDRSFGFIFEITDEKASIVRSAFSVCPTTDMTVSDYKISVME